MIRSYRHFKKQEEIFLGMNLWTLVKVSALTLVLLAITLNLRLSVNSPLFLILSLFWMIVTAFSIKAQRDDEICGHYSSILTHPFETHHYSYSAIGDLVQLKELNQKHNILINRKGELIAALKLDQGFAYSNASEQDRKLCIEHWGKTLSQLQSITSLKSHLISGNEFGDSLQAFVYSQPYQYRADTNRKPHANSDLCQQQEKQWLERIFDQDNYIPDLKFYILIKHRPGKTKLHPLHKLCKKLLPRFFPKDFTVLDPRELDSELDLLEQKIKLVQSSLLASELRARVLPATEITQLIDKVLPLSPLLKQENLADFKLEDKGKYLKVSNPSKYLKTYRLSLMPESGYLDFWLIEYLRLLKIESYLSIQWISRDARADRRQAERKTDIMLQLSKSSKSSTSTIIQENRYISEDLVEQPYSFDFVMYLTLVSKDLEQIQKLDHEIRKEIRGSKLHSVERQQIPNWVNSLPLASNQLKDSDKLFCSKAFAQASFPCIEAKLGTETGPLLGFSLESLKPVWLDEYDRSEFNNRGINFVGDSGSGKTVAAKLCVKRRIARGDSFVIVDNTKDGWEFFVDFFDGDSVVIDTSVSEDGRSFFTPLKLKANYSPTELNYQLEKSLKLFALIKEVSKLSPKEEIFITDSLKTLYGKDTELSFSELYTYWQNLDSELAQAWLDIIAPYCKVCGGIYAGLMDSKEARIGQKSKLILFSFADLDSDSNFLPLSLYLISNYVSKRVIFDGETQMNFVIDEAWKIFASKTSSQGESARDLITYFARAGRGIDLGLWTISQKPKDLPREVHSSASLSLNFQLKEAQDREEASRLASLNSSEAALLAHPLIFDSGTCLYKSTKASGLVKIALDPLEEILCNSTRNFVKQRKQIQKKLGSARLAAEALLETIEGGENARRQMA